MDRRLIFQSAYSLLSNGLPALFGLLSFRILATELGPAMLSTYVLVIAVYGMFTQLRSGILTGAFIKLTSGKEAQSDLVGATWTASLLLSGLLSAFLFAGSFIDQELNAVLGPIILISILSIPTFVADQHLRSQERFEKVAILRMLESGSMYAGLLVISSKGLTYEKALWMLAGANGISGLGSFLGGWAQLKTVTSTSKNALLSLWRFGKFTSGTQLITSLIINTDLFVLRYFLGPSAVGIYEAGRKLMELFEVPMRALSSLYYTRVSAMVNQGLKLKVWSFVTKRAVRVALGLSGVSMVSYVVAPWLIQLIAGPEFEQSVLVFRVLLILPFLLPFDRFYGLSLDALGLPKLNFYKGLILFLVNLCFDILVVQFYPEPHGVALVSVLFYGVGAILSILWLRRTLV